MERDQASDVVNQPVIQAHDLVKAYKPPWQWKNLLRARPDKIALNRVSLEVQAGQIFGLLGPNGAGKTTLLRILVGLVIPDAGTATVNGHDVVKNGREVRASIGVVYGDERSFFWRLSVRENLRFYARLFNLTGKAADSRIQQLIDLVGLTDAAETPMHSFSSGMRQRASIARGLINDPFLIFMDEPTRSLDPVGSQELRRLISERVAAGRTVLLATNLMHEAETLCDRLMLIDQGSELITGTAADFRKEMSSGPVYKLFVEGEETCSAEDFLSIRGVQSAELKRVERSSFLVTLMLDERLSALPAAIRLLTERSLEIVSCTRHEPSLDEVFRELIHRRRQEMPL